MSTSILHNLTFMNISYGLVVADHWVVSEWPLYQGKQTSTYICRPAEIGRTASIAKDRVRP